MASWLPAAGGPGQGRGEGEDRALSGYATAPASGGRGKGKGGGGGGSGKGKGGKHPRTPAGGPRDYVIRGLEDTDIRQEKKSYERKGKVFKGTITIAGSTSKRIEIFGIVGQARVPSKH